MTYRITRASHGQYLVRDEGGTVASAEFDHQQFAWCVEASPERYPRYADLPEVFGGVRYHCVRTFGDLHRFFGCPLPGAKAIATAKTEES